MSIDPSTIKPGGKVSVTLTDGTKIIDSPVGPPNGGRHGLKWAVCGLLNVEGVYIASIDAYTPPTPEWDRPEVFAVKDCDKDTWYRRADGSWWVYTNPKVRFTSERLDDDFGPCTVLAVYADKSDQ